MWKLNIILINHESHVYRYIKTAQADYKRTRHDVDERRRGVQYVDLVH